MLFIICIFYFFTMFSAFGSLNLLTLLFFLEMMSWLFVVLIPLSSSLNYLIIQSYFLVFSLVSILFVPVILIFSFLIKLGLPPFHAWFFRIASTLDSNAFYFMMTFHKLLPLIFMSKIVFSYLSFFFVMGGLPLVGVGLLGSSTLFFTLVFSSMMHSIWMVLSSLLSKGFIVFYWLVYSTLLIFLMMSLVVFSKVEHSYFVQGLLSSKCWLLLSGIPPFVMFWLKVYLLFWLVNLLGLLFSILVLTVSVFALTAYYRTWHFGSMVEYSNLSSSKIGPLVGLALFWGMF